MTAKDILKLTEMSDEQIVLKDSVLELKFSDLLIKKFLNSIINNKFDAKNVLEKFLKDAFIIQAIEKSFNDHSYHQFEIFLKEHKNNDKNFNPREEVTLLESAIINSKIFKEFHKLFFQKLSHKRFLDKIGSGESFRTS